VLGLLLLFGVVVWSARSSFPVGALSLLVGLDLVSSGWTLLVADTPGSRADGAQLRRDDPLQRRWLDAAIERARGGCTMVNLGHPL
jgi:hypothetical protein